MMSASSRKEEGDIISEGKFLKPSISRPWSDLDFRNPRIVRVSRSFGGKDRHSKVCTIRGLRDRRIRLSVPVALQLYDLQHRLGLGQPSKVIDWLIQVTKHDIDNLPPLPFHQGFGELNPQSLVLPYESSAARVRENEDAKYWDMEILSRATLWEEDGKGSISEKGKHINSTEDHENQVSSQKIFPITSTESPCRPRLLNHAFPYYCSYHSDPLSLCLSHFGSHGTVSSHLETTNHGSTGMELSLPSGSPLCFCPPVSATVPSVFASYPLEIRTQVDSDPRLLNHIQFASSSSQAPAPFTYTNSLFLKPFPSESSYKLPFSDPSHNQKQLDYKDKPDSYFS